MNHRRSPLLALALVSTLIAACGGAGAPPPPSPTVAPVIVDSAEAAARVAAARSPLFAGLERFDEGLIGQGSYWEATPLDEANPEAAGWRVAFRVGWGDCPAGCISEHRWTWDVARDGTVTFVTETGATVPPEVLAGLLVQGGPTGVAGLALAGPTCPVAKPDDPACADRPVAGAVLVVRRADGTEAARLSTDQAGFFRAELAAGDYTLEPQPVEGLLGTPGPIAFNVSDRSETFVPVAYDTGIR